MGIITMIWDLLKYITLAFEVAALLVLGGALLLLGRAPKAGLALVGAACFVGGVAALALTMLTGNR